MTRADAGAAWHGDGVRFAVRSAVAEAVELCLFDAAGDERRHAMTPQGDSWSLDVPGIGPGQRYGYRVQGPYDPPRGQRCNAAKLLVDPWTRAVDGRLEWHPAVHGFGADGPGSPEPSLLDSAPFVPRSVVVDTAFAWGDDRRPDTPWTDTVIYEAHVRGLTLRHPDVPAEQRGTFLGLAHDAVIEHLLALGITAVELMPVQHFVSERHLERAGLTNYWGYNPLAWFAPHAGYAATPGNQVAEFKTMVRTLHRAGIEVLLDVVYNHTAEGGIEGATLGLRGLDNHAYYRSPEGDPSRSEDFTGCGNTVDFGHPAARDLVLESLRYWVEEMHVDGFRFDLAPVLGRTTDGFDSHAPMLRRLAEDPVLDGVKLIAEPWDLGPGGYCLGRFPEGWREWNDRFRDGSRRFWRGDADAVEELPNGLVGSPYRLDPRRPDPSIHYVAAHDGFTLADVVSYAQKHNEANAEDNRDGSDQNHSDNLGAEGATDDERILQRRRRRQRALLATVALSRGIPMLCHGDEMGRSQRGNNNAYCQDNEISWIAWRLNADERALLRFARRAFSLRREPGLDGTSRLGVRRTWLDGRGNPLPHDDEPVHRAGFVLRWGVGGRELLLAAHRGGDPWTLALPPVAGHWRLRLDSATGEVTDRALERPRYSAAADSIVLFTTESDHSLARDSRPT